MQEPRRKHLSNLIATSPATGVIVANGTVEMIDTTGTTDHKGEGEKSEIEETNTILPRSTVRIAFTTNWTLMSTPASTPLTDKIDRTARTR